MPCCWSYLLWFWFASGGGLLRVGMVCHQRKQAACWGLFLSCPCHVIVRHVRRVEPLSWWCAYRCVWSVCVMMRIQTCMERVWLDGNKYMCFSTIFCPGVFICRVSRQGGCATTSGASRIFERFSRHGLVYLPKTNERLVYLWSKFTLMGIDYAVAT